MQRQDGIFFRTGEVLKGNVAPVRVVRYGYACMRNVQHPTAGSNYEPSPPFPWPAAVAEGWWQRSENGLFGTNEGNRPCSWSLIPLPHQTPVPLVLPIATEGKRSWDYTADPDQLLRYNPSAGRSRACLKSWHNGTKPEGDKIAASSDEVSYGKRWSLCSLVSASR